MANVALRVCALSALTTCFSISRIFWKVDQLESELLCVVLCLFNVSLRRKNNSPTLDKLFRMSISCAESPWRNISSEFQHHVRGPEAQVTHLARRQPQKRWGKIWTVEVKHRHEKDTIDAWSVQMDSHLGHVNNVQHKMFDLVPQGSTLDASSRSLLHWMPSCDKMLTHFRHWQPESNVRLWCQRWSSLTSIKVKDTSYNVQKWQSWRCGCTVNNLHVNMGNDRRTEQSSPTYKDCNGCKIKCQ